MKSPFPPLLVGTMAIATPLAVGAFGVGRGSSPALLSSSTGGSALRSTPGGWENDDFLNSLGGEGGDPNEGYGDYSQGEPVERIVPQNDLTDEEITMMAMRAAQFYNTDTSLEEAYGVPRQGPPAKQPEEGEEYEDFQ